MVEAVRVVTSSHFKMMADVPLVGWDVAFTETGSYICLSHTSTIAANPISRPLRRCSTTRGEFKL